MNLIIFFIALVWIIRISANLLSFISLWRVKEYRFDRMLVHLQTNQGWMLFPPFRRPPISFKTVTLFLSVGGILGSIILFAPFSLIVRLFVADIVSFPLTWVFIELLNLPTKIYHRVIIAHASAKLRAHKNLLTVGITGSFGKTSIKDYLATILETKFRVLKTKESKNSPIGISEVVLSSLKNGHEIFVVEMGAYKRGEITEMSSMVIPQIGIITAINPQHQDLFGTIENTVRAKYELIAGLRGRKLGIFNADDKRVREMGEWARRDGKDVWWWSKKVHSTQYTVHSKKIFQAKEIKTTLHGVEFQCVRGNEMVRVQASVLGEHQVGNILAAIAGAVACGMSLVDAALAVKKIQSAKGVMQKFAGINGSILIDDTFNNNPDAAKAALSFLAKAPGRKILVFQPMIELGSYSDSAHEEVGLLAGRICDDIVLTNKNSYEAFVRGAKRANPKITISVHSESYASHIKKNLKAGDMVLFKGKEAGHVLRRINVLTR